VLFFFLDLKGVLQQKKNSKLLQMLFIMKMWLHLDLTFLDVAYLIEISDLQRSKDNQRNFFMRFILSSKKQDYSKLMLSLTVFELVF
jgi:hypothetical protein